MITLRKPVLKDGANIYKLANSVGNLDVNSCYSYLLMCQKFADTCTVASHKDEIIGFVIAFLDPQRPEVLFVWQIAVSDKFRNQGLATTMLYHILLRKHYPKIQFIETSITPSNVASLALFRNLSIDLKCDINKQKFFKEEWFGGEDHEPEDLFKIGPISHNLMEQPPYEYFRRN